MAGSKISKEYVEACLDIATEFLNEVMEGLPPAPMANTTSSSDDDDDDDNDDDEVHRAATVSVTGDNCDSIPRIVHQLPDDPKGGDCYGGFDFMLPEPDPNPYARLDYVTRLLEVSKLAIESLPPGHRFDIKQL